MTADTFTYTFIMMSDEDDVTAANFLPAQRSLTGLKRAAGSCRGCRLYEHATQTVFGKASSARG